MLICTGKFHPELTPIEEGLHCPIVEVSLAQFGPPAFQRLGAPAVVLNVHQTNDHWTEAYLRLDEAERLVGYLQHQITLARQDGAA